MVISLHLNDLATLEYIKSVLKQGKIKIYPDYRSPTCKLIINKTDLQEILFPQLIRHKIFFLTESIRAQFNLAMYIFNTDLKQFNKIPKKDYKNLQPIFKYPKTAIEYRNLPFYKDWLVGLTTAEGCFIIIKDDQDCCYQLKKRIHIELFESLKLFFDTKRKINLEKGPINYYNQFAVSSIKDIQTVINFFSFSGVHPLIGQKYIQYSQWLIHLKNSDRYKNLKFPD